MMTLRVVTYFPGFTDKKMGAQRGYPAQPRPCGWTSQEHSPTHLVGIGPLGTTQEPSSL